MNDFEKMLDELTKGGSSNPTDPCDAIVTEVIENYRMSMLMLQTLATKIIKNSKAVKKADPEMMMAAYFTGFCAANTTALQHYNPKIMKNIGGGMQEGHPEGLGLSLAIQDRIKTTKESVSDMATIVVAEASARADEWRS